MGTATERREFTGPALLSYGFRVFFLLSALWAGLAMVIWVIMLSGRINLPMAWDPISWHAHEFLFGYLGGVIAGFILTALPNWTGRLPLRGWPLAGLAGLWMLGRGAAAFSDLLGWGVTAAADLSFGIVLLAFVVHEVVQGRSWRNSPVVVLILLFTCGNAVFHWQAAQGGPAFDAEGARGATAALLMLVALIGGRIIPIFTRNWLVANGATFVPVPFGRGDMVVLGVTVVGLLGFVIHPASGVTMLVLLICGAAHIWRLSRWQGFQVRSQPLLIVLHVAYALLAVGFWAEAAGQAELLPIAAGRHVWLAGGIGLMTLAVMTRATLGHSGRALQAGPATIGIYLALLGGVISRVVAGIWPDQIWLLHLSAALWVVAFWGFALAYSPALLRPRLRA